jgi:hypothetical protein
MRSRVFALTLFAAILSAPVFARAQGDPAAAGSVSPALPPAGAATPAAAAPMASSPSEASSGDGYRPTPLTLGVGFGWLIGAGANILQPSVGSVRIVISETFVLEPFVNLSFTKNEMTTAVTTTDSDVTRAGAGATARFILGSRGPIDLAALGQARFMFVKTDTGTVDTDEVSVNWGLGLSWYFYRTWALSLDATNPLFSWRRTSTQPADTTRTEMFAGAIFSPQVLLILHMFF